MNKALYWPIGITVFLMLYIGFLLSVLVFSGTVPVNLVSEKYYENAIRHDRQIQRVKNTKAAGFTLERQYDIAKQTLTFAFPKAINAADVEGKITFFRPSDAAKDIVIPLKPGAMGKQTINVANLQKGLWRVAVFWQMEGQEFYEQKVLFIE